MNKKSVILVLACVITLANCKLSGEQEQTGDNDSPYVSKILQQAEWEKTHTSHFDIFAIKDSYTAKRLEETGETLEAARMEVLKKLDQQNSDTKSTIFFVGERGQMEELVGTPAGGWTEVKENVIFLVQNQNANAPVRHELGHLYSWTIWGQPKSTWLSEGVALLGVGDCAGNSLHAWAAALKREGQIVPMEQMDKDVFDFSKAAPHLQAGSFLQFVLDEFGVEALKLMWNKGLDGSKEATDKTAKELEQLWLHHISQHEFVEMGKNLKIAGKISCE